MEYIRPGAVTSFTVYGSSEGLFVTLSKTRMLHDREVGGGRMYTLHAYRARPAFLRLERLHLNLLDYKGARTSGHVIREGRKGGLYCGI